MFCCCCCCWTVDADGLEPNDENCWCCCSWLELLLCCWLLMITGVGVDLILTRACNLSCCCCCVMFTCCCCCFVALFNGELITWVVVWLLLLWLICLSAESRKPTAILRSQFLPENPSSQAQTYEPTPVWSNVFVHKPPFLHGWWFVQ